MHPKGKHGCMTLLVARWSALLGLFLGVVCPPTHASDLTRGKKALFMEDFEADVYEWTLMEEGEEDGEDPDLLRTDEAYEGKNALLFSGNRGILGLEFTKKVKGLVEFRVKFPAPHNYTRMFGVGLGEQELLLGVNRSGNFAYAVAGNWQVSQTPVDDQWHTFTYDFSGIMARAYIDGKLITVAEQLHEFDRIRLGVNNGRGGRSLVDAVVIYAGETALSEENAIEVTVPLIDWDSGLKPASSTFDNRYWDTATYSMTEEKSHSGKSAARIAYEPAEEGKNHYHIRFYRSQPLFGIPQKLSLWVHGDGSGSNLNLLFASPNSMPGYKVGSIDWNGWRKVAIDLSKETGRYGREWTAKKAGMPGSAFRGFDITVPPGKGGAVYFDDVALTTKLNKNFPYVFYAESTAEDNIIEAGGEAAFHLLVGNYAQEDKAFTVDYTVQNYWGETVRQGSLQIAALAGQQSLEQVQIADPLGHGWYRARFILAEGGKTITTVEEPVAVLRPLPKSLFCPENPLGNYGGHSRQGAKVGLSEIYLVRLDDLARRDPDAVADWRPTPRQLADIKEHNYTGIVFYHSPAWAYLPAEEMEQEAEKWAERMARLAAGLKGLPIYYKILAEPNNTGISHERCYEVIKYAARGLHKGDPDARIMGLNTSKFDWGRQKVVWALGGLKYVYAAGVHPYCGPRVGSSKPEGAHGIGNLMSMLRLDDMIRRYNQGRPKKIWGSEVGYETTPGGSNSVTWEEQANYVARMVIEFKTMDNFGKIHYHVFRDSYPEYNHFGFFTYYNQPKPLAVSFHSVAERITGVRWLKTLKTPENVRAYLFEQRDGKQMLTAWSVDGTEQFTLPVQCNAVDVMGLMGVYDTQTAPGGLLNLELTESPLFITPTEGKLIANRWVQAITRYRQVRPGEQDKTFLIKVTNEGAQLLEGTLRCKVPAGLALEPAAQPVRLPPGAEQEYEFSLSVLPDCKVALHTLVFSLQTKEPLEECLATTSTTASVVYPDVRISAARVDRAPTLDGKLDEAAWQQATEITQFLDNAGYAPEVKQRLRLVYDRQGLYVGVWSERKRGQQLLAEHTTRDDPDLWRDECVEIFLDPNLDRNNYFQFIANIVGNQSDYKFANSQTRKVVYTEALQWDGQWRVKTFQAEDYWSAEMLIPWETVGVERGRKHKMGLNVSRTHAVVGDPKLYAYTAGGVPNHAVGSYLSLDIDLTE